MLTGDHRYDVFLALLLVMLPVSALIARRVPFVRVAWTMLSWMAIFGVGLVLVGQRERFDPLVGRVARALNLDEQRVVGHEVRIRMSQDGHFWADVSLDGVKRRMLVDSGATVTAVSTGTAAEAGLAVHDSLVPTLIQTANGTVDARVSSVSQLRLGDIRASGLAVVVSPAFGDTDVLGMNFLSRLKAWRVEGRTLVLTPHHPDPKFT